MGLIKRTYPDSEVYVTASLREVDELLATGCEIVAFDATSRPRPGGVNVASLIDRIHAAGALAMADCDSVESISSAKRLGADIASTTLAGYTDATGRRVGLDLELVAAASKLGIPLLAEGRYEEPWQARAALRAGACAVVIGGALNDPVKQTRSFLAAMRPQAEEVGAVDIGGTWLRAGIVSADGTIRDVERAPNPKERTPRLRWIQDWIDRTGVKRVGIGAGGIIDPSNGEVLYSKPIILDHVGTIFTLDLSRADVTALNDGHATAWAHAMHPGFAGKRVATIALGTGVGCGVVDRGRILMGRRGEHPRLNDTPTKSGRIYEELLGGAALSPDPSAEQRLTANEAVREACQLVQELYYPDAIVLAGTVGLADWLQVPSLAGVEIERSPYGSDAGLVGAGFLSMFPPPR